MGRRRSEPDFDAGAAALGVLERLMGREIPEEGWRREYFILEAENTLSMRDEEVESLEGRVDELEGDLSLATEQLSTREEEAGEIRECIAGLEAVIKKAKEALEDVEVDDG